jgi:hypothetical protein
MKKHQIEALILLLAMVVAAKAHADVPVHMSCISRDTKTQLVADVVVMGDGLARGSILRLNGGRDMTVNHQSASISYSLKGQHQTQIRFRPTSSYGGVQTAILTVPGNLEQGTLTTGNARLLVKGNGKDAVATVNCKTQQM